MNDIIQFCVLFLLLWILALVGWWMFTGIQRDSVYSKICRHFRPVKLQDITISERSFPYRVRADVQRAIERFLESGITIHASHGVSGGNSYEELSLAACLDRRLTGSTKGSPLQYEEVDIGDEQPVRCLQNGLWLFSQGAQKFVVLMSTTGMVRSMTGRATGLKFEVGTAQGPEGQQIVQDFYGRLETSIVKAESYRGKILSLELEEHSYSGRSAGIRVHRLHTVERNQIILPSKTLELLDRNVIQFARQREQLAKFHQSTRKGILFYGPPGTGKTHTIHYLAKALPGYTTLLITSGQVGLLGEYMTLARLLQPSIVVIEDADLIGRDRTQMQSACEELMLNKLLNEMDGLKADAEILFILTTNRPAMLESALASRPGRVDQAIEFPLPDEEGRVKLIQLYSSGMDVPPEVMEAIARRVAHVSAAFIKELMRRALQFHLERNGSGRLELQDAENAIQEMLFTGGSLNLKLLGAESPAAV